MKLTHYRKAILWLLRHTYDPMTEQTVREFCFFKLIIRTCVFCILEYSDGDAISPEKSRMALWRITVPVKRFVQRLTV